MEKNILITGGAGFVGSNLAIALKLNHPESDVIALDNLKRRGSELNLRRLKSHGVGFVHGDIRNREDLEAVTLRPDVIIECSAEPSVLAGYKSSTRYLFNTNLAGTLNCLEAARASGADFIFLSTSRVYPIGRLNSLRFEERETRFELTDGQETPGASSSGVTEDFPLAGARSLYGVTKLSSELLVEEYRMMYGMRTVVNRCGVIAGPWQMGKVDQGVFVHWLGSHYFGRPLAYFGYGGTGKQVRDLLHIDDLYTLIDWQMMNMDKVDGEVFNVGGGKSISLSLRETTVLCRELTGRRVEITGIEKERDADVRIYVSDTGKVWERTGWAPVRTAPQILCDIFTWIRANEKELREALFY